MECCWCPKYEKNNWLAVGNGNRKNKPILKTTGQLIQFCRDHYRQTSDTSSRNRFQLLQKFWHSRHCSNWEQSETDFRNRLVGVLTSFFSTNTAISEIRLLEQFQAVYTQEKELSTDESMVLWRGRLMFRQYIPGKWQKCGVKLYTLCEPSAYVWNAVVERKIGFSIWTSDTLIACDEANGKVTGLWPHPLCRQFIYQFPTVSRTTERTYTALWHSTAKSKNFPEAVVSAKLKVDSTLLGRHSETVQHHVHATAYQLTSETHHPSSAFDDI